MTNTTTTGGSRCGRCHRVLKNPQAVEAGYGAVCYRKTFGNSLPGKRKPRAPKGDAGREKHTTAGRSDFDFHLRTVDGRNIIVIEDLDAGGMSVTNNIEAVVAEAAGQLGTDPNTALIIYRDSSGIYDGVRASIGDGRYGFYHLGQKDEAAAIEAALAARGAIA
ncbi:DUF6011 domain-containing protein [Clostridium sp. D33t1_170424_F3]|uniref:DUF6011 domain-containing protein n=1 Tax=Clostridium sp. D33t1_170424_F3 TaxID=2787099 RepID=UPI0018A9942D|nr:DUF6011 domain-containing protein [Clostridium sp. D33t1_170424_F3]